MKRLRRKRSRGHYYQYRPRRKYRETLGPGDHQFGSDPALNGWLGLFGVGGEELESEADLWPGFLHCVDRTAALLVHLAPPRPCKTPSAAALVTQLDREMEKDRTIDNCICGCLEAPKQK